MLKVKDVLEYINEIAPFENACGWDNGGLIVGSKNQEVKRIATVLDLTSETLDRAINFGADLIVTHHPLIFKAKKNILENDVVFKTIKNNISVISAHTCFDCASFGVNDVLADLLGLKVLFPVSSEECKAPMLRLCALPTIYSSSDFAKHVAKSLGTTVRFVDSGKPVLSVALCGGSGMSFLDDVLSCGADAFVTGDISHHDMIDAKEAGLTVVAAGHFETENRAMNVLQQMISKKFPKVLTKFLNRSNPISFVDCKE